MSFILKNWKASQVETKNVLIHTAFLVIALSYIFNCLPPYSGSKNFHLWAPTFLAIIDIITVYCLVIALTYFKKFKILSIIVLLVCSILFLHYSSTINMFRTHNNVMEIADFARVNQLFTWFNKDWVIATLPRLGLLTLVALFYINIFYLEKYVRLLWSKLNYEILINVLLVAGLVIYDQPSLNDHNFLEALVLKLTAVCICYGSAFFLAPTLFKKKNYLVFTISLISGYLFVTGFILAILYYKGEIINSDAQLKEFLFQLSPILGLFTLAGLLYGFIRHLILSKFKKTEEQLGHTTSELLLLKSQVNPHFLFNTLNTLYATALEEDAKVTASATAKLANLVRYMQQDMQQEFIPLDREAGYILDYINIQKLRIASPIDIKTTFDEFGDTLISPGLLIPFVENAFKYGIDPDTTSSISVQLIQHKDHIHFQCQNTFNLTQTTYYREKGFGIGIKNTRERLKLIYPNRYDLQIDKSNKLFTINLKIKTV